MSEIRKNAETVEVERAEVERTEVVTDVGNSENESKDSIFKKGVGFVKKHGKQIGKVVLIAGAGIATGVLIGKRSGDNNSDCCFDDGLPELDTEASTNDAEEVTEI